MRDIKFWEITWIGYELLKINYNKLFLNSTQHDQMVCNICVSGRRGLEMKVGVEEVINWVGRKFTNHFFFTDTKQKLCQIEIVKTPGQPYKTVLC